MSPAPSANIARHLATMAARQPSRVALKVPRGRSRTGDIDYLALSFLELAAEVNAWSHRLTSSGVRKGDRTLLMVRQGLPLIASAFALFNLGAVPVIIDPGMGLKNFLACVKQSRPRAMIGIPLARIVSRLARQTFSSTQIRVAASSSHTARLSQPTSTPSIVWAAEPCSANSTDLAAILFTSGSTGAPKGVCYEHGMFEAQIRLIAKTYSIEPGEIDLPMLPIFALFNPALGMTTIVPEIDPRRPAAVDPLKIVRAIQQENVTNSFGSPTLWRKIGAHCLARDITLPSLKRVLCAGAPVPAPLWESSRTWMPNGLLHSPYGATEALPVSSISADEILRLHRTDSVRDNAEPAPPFEVKMEGRPSCRPQLFPKLPSDDPSFLAHTRPVYGACVGRPVAPNQVKIIAISDEPIASLDDARELSRGEIGEIIVAGPTVTKTYDSAPKATAAAKIAISGSRFSALNPQLAGASMWHRMGDCGYIDDEGRIWFCGRKVERVETANGTLFTEPCEQVFRAHPRVARCALIALGAVRGEQQPALVVESLPATHDERVRLFTQLRDLAKDNPATASITRFYFHRKLPVDVRHNAKIHRLALARWAATARAYDLP